MTDLMIEYTAVIFGLLSVWYAKKEHIYVFPTGIISVLIYVYICLEHKLYADMGINAYYFIMSVYGWYMWSRIDSNKKHIPISIMTKNEVKYSIVMFIAFYSLLVFTLITYTDSDVPFWDSLTTTLFFIGMWLMARKKIENWILWIIGDIISIPLYIYKGLIPSAGQFFIFTIIAILGYIEWKKTLEKKTINLDV